MKRFLSVLLAFTRYSVLLALIIASLAAAADAAPIATISDNDLYYTSETGRFAIMLPMPISLHEQTRIYSLDLHPYAQLAGPSLDCHELGAKDYGAVWFVIYCDYPADALAHLTPDQILNHARDSAFNDNSTLLVDEADITYDDRFTGRAFVYQLDANETDAQGRAYTNIYKARAYMADNRLYWVGAWVGEGNQDNRLSRVDSFLDSFYIEQSM